MAAPFYSAADYLSALQALMPRGRAWPRDTDATQTKLLSGLSVAFANNNAAANQLLVDAFPGTAVALLPEWEATLGLPGTLGPALTTAARQNAVVAALIDVGGQSKPYYIAQAAALGFTITITEFITHTVLSSVDADLAGPDWASAWKVNAPIAVASTGVFVEGIAQATPGTGNAVLEGMLARAKPAHTVCITEYT